MKGKTKAIITVFVVILAGIYYYAAIPAINIHSSETWFFIMIFLVILAVLYLGRKKLNRYEVRESKVVKGFLGVIVFLGVVYLLGTLFSSPVINAKKYQKLMTVKEGEFTKDVDELSFDKIPLLDKDTAALLGDRKMGSMVDMVSQFEADDIYSQINYKGNPVRDHFNRNIYRHLRFAHPTYIYGELSFEIDENGDPYWIAPVKKFNIGLFGGETVGKVVICNAVTGKTKTYDVGNVPQWVDRVYSADLLVNLFDYYGKLKHGFFNSVLSQKDCLETTDGYNYLALNDDVWMYTGVTSVNGDQSNVGFVLANQRTMETKYYKVEGATESSAMSSAEGQVQNLKYQATFPLLLNIAGEPTYFVALKDDAGLVKKYAMVNVQKYQIVAIGDSVSQCQENYNELLLKNGVKEKEKDTRKEEEISGKITKIAQAVLDGNSHYYLMLEDSDAIYDVSVSDIIDVIKCELGEQVTVTYKEDKDVNTVTKLDIGEKAKDKTSSDKIEKETGTQE